MMTKRSTLEAITGNTCYYGKDVTLKDPATTTFVNTCDEPCGKRNYGRSNETHIQREIRMISAE